MATDVAVCGSEAAVCGSERYCSTWQYVAAVCGSEVTACGSMWQRCGSQVATCGSVWRYVAAMPHTATYRHTLPHVANSQAHGNGHGNNWSSGGGLSPTHSHGKEWAMACEGPSSAASSFDSNASGRLTTTGQRMRGGGMHSPLKHLSGGRPRQSPSPSLLQSAEEWASQQAPHPIHSTPTYSTSPLLSIPPHLHPHPIHLVRWASTQKWRMVGVRLQWRRRRG